MKDRVRTTAARGPAARVAVPLELRIRAIVVQRTGVDLRDQGLGSRDLVALSGHLGLQILLRIANIADLARERLPRRRQAYRHSG